MQIRSATQADVHIVLPMVAQICALHEAWDSSKYGFLPNPAARYANWLTTQTSSDRSVFLVADPNPLSMPGNPHLAGFVVGTVEHEIPIYRLSEYGFIHDLWVEADYRRSGVGRQLIEAAVQEFARLQVHQIRLDTARANDAARRLFQSCGFRISTIELLVDLTPSAELPPDATADLAHKQT
jgi:ribosomal protein S18 acetylase RimI-like enzyme